jgi:hypothetical protein
MSESPKQHVSLPIGNLAAPEKFNEVTPETEHEQLTPETQNEQLTLETEHDELILETQHEQLTPKIQHEQLSPETQHEQLTAKEKNIQLTTEIILNQVHALTPELDVVVELVQGPYRSISLYGIDICWGGVIILRRTLLIVLYTFVQFVLLRSLLLFLFCCGFLMFHVFMWPYKDFKANMAEVFSQGALSILAGLNAIRASIDSQQSVPLGPTQIVLDMVDYIDDFFQLWLPIIGISVLIIILLWKLIISVKSFYSTASITCQS